MIASALTPIAEALSFAFAMFWEILWALILGFRPPRALPAHGRAGHAEDDEPSHHGNVRVEGSDRHGTAGDGLCLPDASRGARRARGPLPEVRHEVRAARRLVQELKGPGGARTSPSERPKTMVDDGEMVVPN